MAAGTIKNDRLTCLPGDRLCLADEITIGGAGTYERDGYIYASFAGVINQWKEDKFVYIEIKNNVSNVLIPFPGDIVTAIVVTVTKRFVICSIIAVSEETLVRPYKAILKKLDVTSIKPDAVQLNCCFRPGDVILARVLPMVDLFTYHLTTADREFGVVIASSQRADRESPSMLPVNRRQMQCPGTLRKENRKIAQIFGKFEDI